MLDNDGVEANSFDERLFNMGKLIGGKSKDLGGPLGVALELVEPPVDILNVQKTSIRKLNFQFSARIELTTYSLLGSRNYHCAMRPMAILVVLFLLNIKLQKSNAITNSVL